MNVNVTRFYIIGFFFTMAGSVQSQNTLVSTKYGTISGMNTDVIEFKGIPYAAAPVGKLRWMPPQPLKGWTGIKETTKYGCSCMQWGGTPESKSEDCLYLNIWTPSVTNNRLPVMVWIHGGGFQGGSGQITGENFARKGVVLVSINYRLGIFGFLAHPGLTKESPHHSSGNYGLLDQIAALQWIKDNIKQFGGDPANVTVFGESAGGTSIGYLMASPLAKGLFQRAIPESPSRLCMPDHHLTTVSNGLTPMEQVGISMNESIATLREWDTQKVIDKSNEAMDTLFGENGKGKLGIKPESKVHLPFAHDRPYWAFADGWVIPTDMSIIYAARQQMDVSLMVGYNKDEGIGFVKNLPLKTEQSYKDYLLKTYAPYGDALFKLYPGSTPEQIKEALNNIITDAMFLYGSREIALNNKNPNTYLYLFSRVSPGAQSSQSGAYHSAEIPYVFGQIKDIKNMYDEKDEELSKIMMNAWINFAKTGNPNGNSGLRWPVYEKDKEQYMEFGDDIRVLSNLPVNKLNVFRKVFTNKHQ